MPELLKHPSQFNMSQKFIQKVFSHFGKEDYITKNGFVVILMGDGRLLIEKVQNVSIQREELSIYEVGMYTPTMVPGRSEVHIQTAHVRLGFNDLCKIKGSWLNNIYYQFYHNTLEETF